MIKDPNNRLEYWIRDHRSKKWIRDHGSESEYWIRILDPNTVPVIMNPNTGSVILAPSFGKMDPDPAREYILDIAFPQNKF